MIIEKEIESHTVDDGIGAYLDAKFRSIAAIEKYPRFFNNPKHLEKVDKVKSIVENFFRIKKGVYVNQRGNGGKPMTAIKVADPIFPNSLSHYEKQRLYYKPLEEMGVEVVYAKGTNSWIYRVR